MEDVLVTKKDAVFGTLDAAVKQRMDTDMYLVIQEHLQLSVVVIPMIHLVIQEEWDSFVSLGNLDCE